MKMINRFLLVVALLLGLIPVAVHGQGGPGRMPGAAPGPQLGGGMAKLFGDNSAFSATLEMQTKNGSDGQTMTMPGKLAFADGNSRFEMDMTQFKGGGMRPEAAAQMKSMGMDRMVTISRPDRKLAYSIYPGLQAHLEMPLPDSQTAGPASDYKVETTEVGKDTVDGHPCVKNKTVVTNSKGDKHEATVWNATDLKNFPVKIEQLHESTTVTMLFKDIKLEKPEAGQFEPPSDSKRYENMQSMMQAVMMKRFGGGQGLPPRNR